MLAACNPGLFYQHPFRAFFHQRAPCRRRLVVVAAVAEEEEEERKKKESARGASGSYITASDEPEQQR